MAEIVVALDYPSAGAALEMVETLGEAADFYKVGVELFTREGPTVLEELRERDKRIFLDLKLHDIPNTVAGAVRAGVDAGAEIMTVHTAGGAAMLDAAREAAGEAVRLVGVTVLTSLTAAEVEAVWGRAILSLREEVLRMAQLAGQAGLEGVVASAQETAALKRRMGPDFFLVTPGIRLPESDEHDQSRVATPGEAARAGSDLLVVGRAVTQAADPGEAMERVLVDVEEKA